MTIFLLRCPTGASPDGAGLLLADRCHSLTSLDLPPAALSSLPPTVKIGNVNQNEVATTTKFVYNGGKVIAEYTGTKRVDYLYDENGMLYGFIYNNAKYFYIRDTLQNIMGIVDANGNAVVHYNYTAYGECKAITGSKASTIGTINSFRYKGYYFDAETEFFYCNARYYSPDFCRFISPDSAQYLEPKSIDNLNLYCYCCNDSINKYDPSGHFALTTFGICAIAGIVSAAVILGGSAQLASNALAGETGSDLWRGVAGAALGSGVNALVLCTAPFTGGTSLVFAAGLGAIAQTCVDTLETVVRGEEVNRWQIAVDLSINFATTFAGNWLGAKVIPTNSGWFKPQKFLSVFTKPYGQKILLQTTIGAGLSETVNLIRKFDWKKSLPAIPVPTVPIYLYF